jgi:hypothetical protein
MAQTFLVFDFGANEETAQQARLTLERWKQSFRLDKKLLLKFDRAEAEVGAGEPDAQADVKPMKGAKKKKEESAAEGRTVLIVRLDFSDHEKLSHQRWVDRIPADPQFKEAHPKVIRHGEPEFEATSERFLKLS